MRKDCDIFISYVIPVLIVFYSLIAGIGLYLVGK